MNKWLGVLILFVGLASCDKEKQSLRRLNGEWEITSYQEIIFDGTTEMFTITAQNCGISSSAKSKEGQMDISWTVENENTTSSFAFSGNFKQVSIDLLSLISDSSLLECAIPRQLKKDMTLEMVVNPNRKSLLHLRKK